IARRSRESRQQIVATSARQTIPRERTPARTVPWLRRVRATTLASREAAEPAATSGTGRGGRGYGFGTRLCQVGHAMRQHGRVVARRSAIRGSPATPSPAPRSIAEAQGTAGPQASTGREATPLRPAVSPGDVFEPAAHPVNPLHGLAVGREQQAGAVVDDDLDSACHARDLSAQREPERLRA